MSEEQQTPAEGQVEVPAIEQQARELGWRPKEEFYADPKNEGKPWRDAERFVELTPLFKKIDEQHRQIKDLHKTTRHLAEHNQKIEKLSYEKALATLRAERRQALEEGDLVKAEELRDRIDDVKEQSRSVAQQQTQPQLSSDFESFVERNPWYNTNAEMTRYANGLAMELNNQGVRDPAVALARIEEETRKAFAPKTVRNPNKDSAPNLEGGRGKAKSDNFSLTPEQERIMNTLIKSGAPISREDYIKQLKQLEG